MPTLPPAEYSFHQMAGGIGLHVHNVRASGSPIAGTGGTSNGLVPMLRNFDPQQSPRR